MVTRSAVSVDELKRAWSAVQAGHFKPATPRQASASTHLTTAGRDAADVPTWAPVEHVLSVIGCVGSAGATTTALGLATAATGPTRVIECCSLTASGLAAASTAELGSVATGWTQGRRDGVLLERVSDVLVTVWEVPLPTTPDPVVELTVLDVGWELGQVSATPSWLGEQLLTASVVVAVTTATVPGIRRLEGALSLLPHAKVIAAVVGPRRRRWSRGVDHGMGPRARALDRRGGLVPVPLDHALAVRGLDSAPLPTPLLQAASHILGLAEVGAHQKGTHP